MKPTKEMLEAGQKVCDDMWDATLALQIGESIDDYSSVVQQYVKGELTSLEVIYTTMAEKMSDYERRLAQQALRNSLHGDPT